MNRQERRRLGIKRKDPMVSIKQSDIDRMKEEATEKGCKLAFGLMLAVRKGILHSKNWLNVSKPKSALKSIVGNEMTSLAK